MGMGRKPFSCLVEASFLATAFSVEAIAADRHAAASRAHRSVREAAMINSE